MTSTTRLLLAATLLAGLAACSDGAGSPTQPSDVTGDIAADADTPPVDTITALTDPVMVRRDRVDYLADSDLILGVVIDGEDRAYPLNIGWWHEIVNDTVAGHAVSVTF